MLTLDDLKKDLNLINSIDWDMTPEEAVTLYLEWGNNWAHGNYVIRSKDDVSYYFVINTWGESPVIYLVRRNSEQADEVAEINLPAELKKQFMDSVGHNKGTYPIEGEVKSWLKNELKIEAQ